MKKSLLFTGHYLLTFLEWACIAVLTGAVCGVIGALFHHAIEWAASLRASHHWIYFLLPLGGMAVVGVYRLLRVDTSTGMNDVIDVVRSDAQLPVGLGPSIFAGTVLSQLAGASTGREGAAIQLGAGVAAALNRLFRLKEENLRPLLLCGMGAVFAAMFGTPVAAALFIVEFIDVGEMRYARIVPCMVGAVTAYVAAAGLGAAPVRYTLETIPELSVIPLLQTGALSIAAAGMSIVFCMGVHGAHELCHRTVKNDFVRAAAGGAALLGLTLIIGVHDYNGAGMNLVSAAIAGEARPEAFILKLAFTALSIFAGFKGGEIVPAFAVGASLGCVLGGLIGMPPGFAAAIGMIALFCGVVNCPVASIVLSVEIFGTEGLPYFAVACAICYMLSGYYSLYGKQKFLHEKLGTELVRRKIL